MDSLDQRTRTGLRVFVAILALQIAGTIALVNDAPLPYVMIGYAVIVGLAVVVSTLRDKRRNRETGPFARTAVLRRVFIGYVNREWQDLPPRLTLLMELLEDAGFWARLIDAKHQHDGSTTALQLAISNLLDGQERLRRVYHRDKAYGIDTNQAVALCNILAQPHAFRTVTDALMLVDSLFVKDNLDLRIIASKVVSSDYNQRGKRHGLIEDHLPQVAFSHPAA